MSLPAIPASIGLQVTVLTLVWIIRENWVRTHREGGRPSRQTRPGAVIRCTVKVAQIAIGRSETSCVTNAKRLVELHVPRA